MELKEGSLDAQVALGPLSPDQVRSIVRQVLAALGRLHRDNKTHGAVRPANLHVGADGNVKLADPAANVSGKEVRGPAKYLAPELLKPEFGAVGPRVDLYCLGFTALELLAGPAFDAHFAGVGPQDIDIEIAWMRWHSSPDATLPPATDLIPGLPTDLGTVLDRLLQKNVQDRYASASEALQALEAAPAAPIHADRKKKGDASTFDDVHTIGPQPQGDWRPSKRDTMPSGETGSHFPFGVKAVVSILAVLLLAGLAGFAWFHFQPAPSDKIAATIASFPPHAKVFINDKPLGKATDNTYELPPGEYTLRLELENYEPFEGKIGISESRKFHKITLNKVVGSATITEVNPKPNTRNVRIASNPKGASVYINDTLQNGTTDRNFVVPDSPFTLKLAFSGYKSLERRISSPEQLNDTLALERIRRLITLESDPKGAVVYLNDQLQDRPTNGTFEVNDGPLVLKLEHKGLPPKIMKFDDTRKLDKAIEVVFDRTVTVHTEPSGATLYLDGKERQEKSPAVLTLKPGKYQVKAMMPGYAPEEKTLVVGVESKLFQEDSLTLRALTVARHALLIGVREGTKDLPSFVHAEPDAEALARTLQFGGFKAGQVAVLTQTRGLAKPDDMPTADNIKQRLQVLAANGAAADILVVVLIGHVVEGPGGAYYCPVGANLPVPDTLVSLADVLDALAAAPAQKKLLILDCWRKDWKNADKLAHVRAWDKTPPPGVTILYGCAKGQTGYEHPTSWHGVFNHYLIQGLLGEAAQPQITGNVLANYCRQQVSKLVADTFREADQVPVLASAQGGESWTITSPGATTADYLLGCARLETQAYEKAIEAFNRAEPSLPGFVELYLRRAEGYYRLGEFDRVMMDCRAALNLDSNNADAYASLAESQAAKKDFISAGKSGARAVDMDPQCALAFDALGSVYRSSEDYDSAVKYITSAIHLQPELFIYYYHRGLVYWSNKQWDNAIADFSEAIKRNDHTAILYADRGKAWRQKKNPKLAIEDYSQAIKLNGTVSSWWLTRGTLRIDGDLDKAIVDLDKATKLKGDYPLAWFNLGYAYSKKQMYPLAIEALSKALQLDPNYANAKRLLKEIAERK